MKVRLLTHIVAFVLLSCNTQAQSCAPPFDSLKAISTADYKLQVPVTWRELTAASHMGLIKVFDATTNAPLPLTYNNKPVIVFAFVIQKHADGLDKAVENCMNEYRLTPQKVFEENFTDQKEYVSLGNGYEGYLLHTRFYRETNGMYQSQYDLILYSETMKTSVCYTLTIQYNDSTYQFEDTYKLKAFAQTLFSYFHPQWN